MRQPDPTGANSPVFCRETNQQTYHNSAVQSNAVHSGARQSTEPVAEFRQWCGCWWLSYNGLSIPATNCRGLKYIQHLLLRSGHAVSANELHLLGYDNPEAIKEAAALNEGLETRDVCHAKQNVHDSLSMSAYKERLREIDEDIRAAQDGGDVDRQEELEEERTTLLKQVKSHLPGRAASFSTQDEGNRKAVSKAIKHAITTIWKYHPGLAEHLDEMIVTGVTCTYRRTGALQWEGNPVPAHERYFPSAGKDNCRSTPANPPAPSEVAIAPRKVALSL